MSEKLEGLKDGKISHFAVKLIKIELAIRVNNAFYYNS